MSEENEKKEADSAKDKQTDSGKSKESGIVEAKTPSAGSNKDKTDVKKAETRPPQAKAVADASKEGKDEAAKTQPPRKSSAKKDDKAVQGKSSPKARKDNKSKDSSDKAQKRDGKSLSKSRKRQQSGGGAPDSEFEERVVAVNRVAKVVKGGRRFSFSALMVVGDKKGRVGFGLGKAKEVPEAIRKATQTAQKKLIEVPLDKGTIPHEIIGEFDAGKVLFRPAAEGTGVKAAGACRTIMELAGVKDVLTKSLRGNNPHNIVKATFKALRQLRSVEEIASVRDKEAKNLRIN